MLTWVGWLSATAMNGGLGWRHGDRQLGISMNRFLLVHALGLLSPRKTSQKILC